MKRRLLLGFVVLALAFGALPALAAAPVDLAGDATLAAIFAPAPDLGTSPQPQDAAKRPRITPKASCTAQCWNGSSVSCSSANGCSAIDSACPGQVGSCTVTGGATTYCPPCPCTVTATCSPSGTVSCTGSCDNSFSLTGCYAECDDVVHWCPSPKRLCPF